MPSTYSHYYFGCLVHEHLPKEKKDLVIKYRLFYDAGQNGPDLLLYHSALKPSVISQQNHDIHRMAGADFFHMIKSNSGLSSQHLVYIYGYICHFVLDAYLHPYVEQYKDNHQISHMLIEREFERLLLEKNELSPFKYNLTTHIRLNSKLYEVMSCFVNNASAKDMKNTLCRMKKMYLLTKASNGFKRKLIYLWMDCHHKSYLKDFVFTKTADSRCDVSNEYLEKRLHDAVAIAVNCIEEFDNNHLIHPIWKEIFG